jgi:hypothetical protein
MIKRNNINGSLGFTIVAFLFMSVFLLLVIFKYADNNPNYDRDKSLTTLNEVNKNSESFNYLIKYTKCGSVFGGSCCCSNFNIEEGRWEKLNCFIGPCRKDSYDNDLFNPSTVMDSTISSTPTPTPTPTPTDTPIFV